MPEYENLIAQEERKFLREELVANKKFLLERPLVIAGAALALSAKPMTVVGLMAFLFLAALLLNLWLTWNRLRNSARIIAYVQLVHEVDPCCGWIGWENALRAYRTWLGNNSVLDLKKYAPSQKQYDSMGFYSPIWWFHLVAGIALTAILLVPFLADEKLPVSWSWEGAIPVLSNLACLLVFVVWLFRYSPRAARHGIEYEREIWVSVLGRLKLDREGSNEKNTE